MKKVNRVEEAPFVIQFSTMMMEGYQKGWHELNGGNMSYRIKSEDIKFIKHLFHKNSEWITLQTQVEELGDEYFLVTGSGRFFKNIFQRQEETIGIIHINPEGTQYKKVWGLLNSKPTSELSSHLLNHQVKKRASNNTHRLIYHAHTTNLIALTFVLPLDGTIFTRELWETATECPVVFPEGIGVVPWMVPGGSKIGIETSKLMEHHNIVIWAHHGTFCSGSDFDTTFGLMETVEKAAEILVKVLSMGGQKLQTITSENLRDLSNAFNVKLQQKYLF